MRIRVRVFGDLVPLLGRNHLIELDNFSTVGSLTGVIAEKAGMKRPGYLGKFKVSGGDLAILVNGRNIDLLDGVKTILKDGDEVVYLPPAPGG